MAGCVTDVTYKRARHPNENHQNACSFFGLLLIPYSYPLFFTLYSSLLLLIPSSYLLSVKPPYNSDMKRVSCSENVNFVR